MGTSEWLGTPQGAARFCRTATNNAVSKCENKSLRYTSGCFGTASIGWHPAGSLCLSLYLRAGSYILRRLGISLGSLLPSVGIWLSACAPIVCDQARPRSEAASAKNRGLFVAFLHGRGLFAALIQ